MGKRIAAWIAIVVIGLCYLVSAIAAVMARPEAMQLFIISLFVTVFVPIVLWVFIKLYENVHKNDGITVKELKEMEKRVANGENPEELAKEIEEKYSK